MSIAYWLKLYDKFKFESLCLDIETSGIDKPITIIGVYRPKDGPVQYDSFIRGISLTAENLKPVLHTAKMFITYNGFRHDIPYIRKEFPDAVPKVPILDLYLLARQMDLNTNLKVMEATMGIERLGDNTDRRGIAVKLWKRYQEGNYDALQQLLDYNKEDTINLYPLAEKIRNMVDI